MNADDLRTHHRGSQDEGRWWRGDTEDLDNGSDFEMSDSQRAITDP